MIKHEVCQTDGGVRFDTFVWTGDRECLPDWMGHPITEEDSFHGRLLHAGPYLVRIGSRVLRNQTTGHIFAVKAQLFADHYTLMEGENQ